MTWDVGVESSFVRRVPPWRSTAGVNGRRGAHSPLGPRPSPSAPRSDVDAEMAAGRGARRACLKIMDVSIRFSQMVKWSLLGDDEFFVYKSDLWIGFLIRRSFSNEEILFFPKSQVRFLQEGHEGWGRIFKDGFVRPNPT